MPTVIFLIFGLIIAQMFEDRSKKRKEEEKLIQETLNECFAELGFGNKKEKSKPKYRMKEVEDEGALFFTDATDFNEAFKL